MNINIGLLLINRKGYHNKYTVSLQTHGPVIGSGSLRVLLPASLILSMWSLRRWPLGKIKHVLDIIFSFNINSLLNFFDCMHIIFFSQANFPVGQIQCHLILNFFFTKKNIFLPENICLLENIFCLKMCLKILFATFFFFAGIFYLS